MMSYSFLVVFLLVSLLPIVLSYPPYYDPRLAQENMNNDWRDLAMWSQPPARPEYEPSYGFPDYGDYGDPRPAYSEMDILREQLARSEPPFNKRLPPIVDVPAGGSPPWDVASQGTWYDREVPVALQQPEDNNNYGELDNEKLQRYTEALMEALAREIEENKSKSRLMMAQLREQENEAEAEEEEDDEDDGDEVAEVQRQGAEDNEEQVGNDEQEDEDDQDNVVEELKEAAIKKKSQAQVAAQVVATAKTDDATPSPAPTGADTRHHGAAPEDDTPAKTTAQQGQKEIPMLRPRVPNRRPATISQANVVDDVNRSRINNVNNFIAQNDHPAAAPAASALADYRPKEAANVKRSRGQLPVRMPRFDLRRQVQPFVAREDDLTQELDSLKKKSH